MDSIKAGVTETTQAISNLEQRIEHKLTVLWHDVEEWQRDNHFIHSGYRPQSNSFKKSAERYIMEFFSRQQYAD
jgi:adiponectin receptor